MIDTRKLVIGSIAWREQVHIGLVAFAKKSRMLRSR
jgi:hypothetical protein